MRLTARKTDHKIGAAADAVKEAVKNFDGQAVMLVIAAVCLGFAVGILLFDLFTISRTGR